MKGIGTKLRTAGKAISMEKTLSCSWDCLLNGANWLGTTVAKRQMSCGSHLMGEIADEKIVERMVLMGKMWWRMIGNFGGGWLMEWRNDPNRR